MKVNPACERKAARIDEEEEAYNICLRQCRQYYTNHASASVDNIVQNIKVCCMRALRQAGP